jgi:methionine-rich copper-binding protein CopC
MAANWTNAQVLSQLISGYKWTLPTIYYAFPTSSTGMYSTDEAATFRPVSSSQQTVFVQAIRAWDDLIPQTFQQTYANTSDIEFAFTSNIEYAHARYPTNGSAWFLTGSDISSARIGSYGFMTIMHEIGHALGLDHMGDYNGSGSWQPSSFQDSDVLSIMSYFGPKGAAGLLSSEVAGADWTAANLVTYCPQTPMLNDVMAIQSIYGVSTTTRTSDTIYGFNTNITDASANWYDFALNKNPILTIFDSGGKDTLDLSGWSTPSTIYLESGVYSSCNDMTNNIVIAYSCTIENAIGGSGNDTITGNAVVNRLEGGLGNDRLSGGGGDDVLVGGSGNDVIYGGSGSDTVVFSGTFSSYSITYSSITFAYTISGAQDGTDVVYSAELFQFSDITKQVTQTTGADTTAPTLISVSPPDGSATVAVDSSFVLTLSEAVKAGSGSITIFNNDGTAAKVISASDTSQVTVSGGTVTINPASDLIAGKSYYINVGTGALVDLAGNGFAGITGSSTYNFSTQASAVVDDYPWSTATTGVVTVNGAASNGTVESVDDADLFKVNLTAGTTYVFDLVSVTGGLADPYLWLYSPTIEVVTFDDDGGTGVNAQIIYKPSQSGTFYLGAADFGSGLGAYKISAATQTGKDDYSANTSTTGVLGVGAQVTGTIEIAKDEDWFKVTLQAGTTYAFELKGYDAGGGTLGSGTFSQPYLSLYDSSGYFKNSTASGGVGGDPLLRFTPTVSGTYYVSAEDLYSTSTGTYTLKATSLGVVVDDYRADTSTSGVLVIGGQVTGNIEAASDQDWFKVSLQAGNTYTFELKGYDSGGGTLGSGTSHQPYLSLYDSNGLFNDATASGGAGGDPLLSFTPTITGNYFLSADDLYSTGTGTYTIKASSAATVSDDYPWSTSTTGVVTVNGNASSGAIESVNDGDLFKINLTAGTTYVFDLIGATGGLADPYLWLYSPDAVLLSSDDDGGDLLSARLTYTASTSGTYYLGAEASDTGTGAYKISARAANVAKGPAEKDLVYVFKSEKTGAGISPASSSYFYTVNPDEAAYVRAQATWPWVEKTATFEAAHSNPNDAVPVFRFWSDKTQSHFFTISAAEKAQIIDWSSTGKNGYDWKYEGENFKVYTSAAPTDALGNAAIPVYRAWMDDKDFNPANGVVGGHFFTADRAAYDAMVKLVGVTGEGVAFYGEVPGP